jgi:hypothetical protein
MRTHYGPWQPCWISNQHQKQKFGRGPSSEHFWQVWLISVQRFQRRRFKCEKLTTDGRTTDTYPWQKLTWPMARWANEQLGHHQKTGSQLRCSWMLSFLLLIRHPPCYSYIQSNLVKVLPVIGERKHLCNSKW